MQLKLGKHVYPLKGLLTAFGATLLLISMAVDFSYANLNTYVISYIRYHDNSTSYADWVFVTSSKVFVQGITMPFLGQLELKIGTKPSILIGCMIYSGGIALTSFTIKYGLVPVVFSMAVTHGVAFGLIYAQAIGSVIKWFLKDNKGFMSSIAVSGYGFGSLIWIPLETAYVNPKNIDPIAVDLNATNSDKYFVDPEVLDNVPSLFLLLGGIFAGLQLMGLLLIQIRSKSEIEETEKEISDEKSEIEKEGPIQTNLTILQTISKSNFWLLWTIFMTIQVLGTFINSYQKTFGQNFITDDFFFVYVGLASNILNGSSRMVWGKLYDIKGFRFNAFLIGVICTSLSWICLLHYVIPKDQEMFQKIFYGIWISVFFAAYPGIYASVAPVTEATFGHLNYSRDFGLLFTQSMFSSIVLTLCAQLLYDKISYAGMFTICGGFGIIGLVATWKFKPTRLK